MDDIPPRITPPKKSQLHSEPTQQEECLRSKSQPQYPAVRNAAL